MIKSFISICLCAMALSACVTGVERKNAFTAPPFKTVEEAVFGVDPVVKASKEVTVSVKKNVSPKLFYQNAEHYFEVVEIEGKIGQLYIISVGGKCDCLGPNKWYVDAIPLMFGPDGKAVVHELVSEQVGGHTLTGKFAQTGMFKLLVFVNSNRAGEIIEKTNETTFISTGTGPLLPLTLTVTRSYQATGLVRIDPKIFDVD